MVKLRQRNVTVVPPGHEEEEAAGAADADRPEETRDADRPIQVKRSQFCSPHHRHVIHHAVNPPRLSYARHVIVVSSATLKPIHDIP